MMFLIMIATAAKQFSIQYKVSTRLMDSYSGWTDYPAFSFSINQEVDVTESYIPEFSVSQR